MRLVCSAVDQLKVAGVAIEAEERLESAGVSVTPVLITVDPKRDTVARLRVEAPKRHARLVGLTGSDQALDKAYKAFQVERSVVFQHPEYGDVYAHGSYSYLLDAEGRFKTLFQPVLGPERMVEIVQSYHNPS